MSTSALRSPDGLHPARHVLLGTDFEDFGGGEQNLLEWAVGLARRGWHPSLVAPAGPICRRARTAGVPVLQWDGTRRSLDGIFRDLRPDICHLASYGQLTRALSLCADRRQVPIFLALSALGFPGGWRSRRFVRRTHTVLAASQTVAGDVQGTGVPVRRLVVLTQIPQDVLHRSPRREPFGPPGRDQIVVGWIGRFDPVKRLEDALQAFAMLRSAHPRARLVIAARRVSYGDTAAAAYEAAIQQLVERLQLGDSVEVRPDVEDIGRFLDGVDLFVTSSESETFSRSTFEAMAMGRAIVSTRAGAIPELIRDGIDGLLVAPGDVGALAANLTFLTSNPREAVRLGAAARVRAAWLGAGPDRVTRLIELYETALTEFA